MTPEEMIGTLKNDFIAFGIHMTRATGEHIDKDQFEFMFRIFVAGASSMQKLLEASDKKIIQGFYKDVCKHAEEKMLETGKLEGAHYAAMKQLMKEWED